MTQTIVALAYSKQRNMFGLVGIEIDEKKKIAYVRLAKQWKRDDMNEIPLEMKELYEKVKWQLTYADQQVGQHIIRSVEKALSFQVMTITTQKNLKDPEDIELIKVMDMTEMVQLTLSIKQEHRIQFPKKNPTNDMLDLIKQMEMFTEHVTEQGTVSYYAPGEELDCLPRALMICCFVGRMALQEGMNPDVIMQGHSKPITADESFDNMFKDVLGDDADLSVGHLNRMSKTKIFNKTKRNW